MHMPTSHFVHRVRTELLQLSPAHRRLLPLFHGSNKMGCLVIPWATNCTVTKRRRSSTVRSFWLDIPSCEVALSDLPPKFQLSDVRFCAANKRPTIAYGYVAKPSEYRPPPFLATNCNPVGLYVCIHLISASHKAVILGNGIRARHFDPVLLCAGIPVCKGHGLYAMRSACDCYNRVVHPADNDYPLI